MSDAREPESHQEPSPPPASMGEPSRELQPKSWQPIVRGGVTVGVCACLVGAAFYFLDRPVLVPVTGRVLSAGKPLENAFVMSIPVGGGATALGPLDDEGNFRLETNGAEGAYTGKHKLLVKAYGRGMPPVPTVPSKYLDETTTPLTIQIRKGEANHFQFEIEPK